MSWLLITIAVWSAVAMTLALLIGRSIRMADERELVAGSSAVPDFVPDDWTVPTRGSL